MKKFSKKTVSLKKSYGWEFPHESHVTWFTFQSLDSLGKSSPNHFCSTLEINFSINTSKINYLHLREEKVFTYDSIISISYAKIWGSSKKFAPISFRKIGCKISSLGSKKKKYIRKPSLQSTLAEFGFFRCFFFSVKITHIYRRANEQARSSYRLANIRVCA